MDEALTDASADNAFAAGEVLVVAFTKVGVVVVDAVAVVAGRVFIACVSVVSMFSSAPIDSRSQHLSFSSAAAAVSTLFFFSMYFST